MGLKNIMGIRKSVVLCLLCTICLVSASGCGEQKKASEEEESLEVDRVVKAPEIETGETLPEEIEVPQISEEWKMQVQAMIDERRQMGEMWSVYVEDISSGASACLGDEQMESASLIKLYTAAVSFQYMDELESRQNYEGETLELLGRMIRSSDNDAANEVVRRLGNWDAALGMQRVNEFCVNGGFAQTHMGRLMLDFDAADDNYTSAENCGRLVAGFCRNEWAGSEVILSFMREQERTGKIPAGLPAGTGFANKTGELEDVENDVAVIYSLNSTYVLCVMSNRLLNTADARNLISEISGVTCQYMAKN